MFRNLFNPENGLMITMGQISDIIFLSLFWIVGCIPVVTVGASFAALYDAVYQTFRKGEKNSWRQFFVTYKGCLKSGILPTVVFLGAFALLARGLIGAWNGAVAGTVSWMLFSGAMLLGVLALGMLSVLFPMLSRFENSLGALLKNTVLLSLANLPRTLLLGLVNALALFACLNWVFPVFFLPALAALIGTLCIEPMFKPYL